MFVVRQVFRGELGLIISVSQVFRGNQGLLMLG